MLIEDVATRLSGSSRNALSAGLIIVAAIALYSWIVAPHVAQLRAMQRYEPAVDKIADGNKAISTTLANRKKRLGELRQRSARFRTMLFAPDRAAELFSDLQTIAEQTGCGVISVNFAMSGPATAAQGSAAPVGVASHRATLSVVGTYDQIVALIKRLRTRTQKVWVDTLAMVTFNIDLALVRCDMTITIYTIEDEEA